MADKIPEEEVQKLQNLTQECKLITQKIAELESDYVEHSLVIDAIKDLDPERKCFRMVGGVLMERTVKEVLPAVIKNREGIKQLMEKFEDSYKTKSKELSEQQSKLKVRTRELVGGSSASDKPTASSSSAGVLV
eukprot:TRINITY_DN11416_c0_g1::TRINITY_DN11416_c0_g1_i1::g.26448::m.26448 TRINITY_DN11416_c0_g1::TRINITY_DN11416_c0_g1_i1::g.26448  ORF type:complete len:148 (-),score=37.92,sp/B0BN18/PFD2_RAT/45.52/6e-27,Prefoldin_2/PF01920.15/5.3e-21,Gp-FAR-1/PF05823.7/0.047,Gp-FAR-1/PF05823.7/5.8,IncA/PF04156.9/0.69,IncA/PF04156.9/2.2,DUF3552/PF12072.3/1.2e+02,DUF3552/PF12072.3/0.055,GLE1/PF07817.8/19,GLE1/PF07817.8/1.3,Tho2/PF11262.3/2,Tho2/PF11262.3/20,TMCO5/PF14992.1/0.48,TMCO5/PF14992.1/35 TRINITY_DN11416_c0_g1_i